METTRGCPGLPGKPGHRQTLELELVKLKEQTQEMEQQLTDAQQVAVCTETETEKDKNPSKPVVWQLFVLVWFFFVRIVFDLMYLDPKAKWWKWVKIPSFG